MPAEAPITVPIEISAAGSLEGEARVFRLARWIGVHRILLGGDVGLDPEWLGGPLRLLFHLPGDPLPVTCTAKAVEVVVERDTDHERAERRALLLEGLAPEAALRVERYVEERLTVS